MTYALGIDVGTSYTAAATWRPDGRQHTKAEVVPLGNRAASVASVLVVSEDRTILVGEAAERRAISNPDRVIREFKRRIGDDTPLFVGGQPHAAHDLAATMVRWAVARVAEREGGPADRIAITHPASWGPYKQELFRGALRAQGLDDLQLLTEPEAAAISYAALERVEAGTTIAVYDLGGGTFDAAVVRKTGTGSFTLLGNPEGLDQLGGADFDEAVFAHVRDRLGAELDALDIEDPNVLSGLARLRRECTEAKEALSSDTEVAIPVLLPGISTQIRLVRSEFEDMIRPALEQTVESLSRAIHSAGLTSEDLGAVLLVGGSSRVPLVAQMVSAELGCPVVVDADPKTTIALGAALSFAPQPAPEDSTTALLAPPATVLPPVALPDPHPQSSPDRDQDPQPDHSHEPVRNSDQEPSADEAQMPQRPIIPAQRQLAEEEGSSPRRKLALVALCSVAAIGLITGGILLPAAWSQGESSVAAQGAIPVSGAGGAEGAGDTGAAGNLAKMSAAGGLSFRGPEQPVTTTSAPGSPAGTADPTAPANQGAQGGRVTAPAAAPPRTTQQPAPGAATHQPPPPPATTTHQPPPPTTTTTTTEEPPPPPPPPTTTTTEEPPPPTSTTMMEPPPTTEPTPATSS